MSMHAMACPSHGINGMHGCKPPINATTRVHVTQTEVTDRSPVGYPIINQTESNEKNIVSPAFLVELEEPWCAEHIPFQTLIAQARHNRHLGKIHG